MKELLLVLLSLTLVPPVEDEHKNCNHATIIQREQLLGCGIVQNYKVITSDGLICIVAVTEKWGVFSDCKLLETTEE